MTPSVLTEILSHFGDLHSIDFVPHHPGTTKLKGVAYARFSTSDEARAALECLAPGSKSSPEKKGNGVIIDQEEDKKGSEVKDTEEKQVSSEEEDSEKEVDKDSKKRR